MSPAESILCETMREVHPGAGSVRQCLAGHGNSRYLYEDVSLIVSELTNRVEPRISPPLYTRGGVFDSYHLE
jgi:hypothetical protein